MCYTDLYSFSLLRIFVILFYREQYDSVNSSPQLYQTHMFITEEDWLWKKLFHSASQEISQTWLLLMKIVKYQVSFVFLRKFSCLNKRQLQGIHNLVGEKKHANKQKYSVDSTIKREIQDTVQTLVKSALGISGRKYLIEKSA